MSESYIEVELNQQPIELYKLLKIADLVSGGGEAKVVISEGYVLLNGEVEYRKRKKIYHEDIIEFNGEVIQLIINSDNVAAEPSSDTNRNEVNPDVIDNSTLAKQNTAKPRQRNNDSNHATETDVPSQPKKRRPIAFK